MFISSFNNLILTPEAHIHLEAFRQKVFVLNVKLFNNAWDPVLLEWT